MTSPAEKLAAYHAARRAERVEFVEQQLSWGFNAQDIAADLGIDHNSVAKSMYRAGRPDLARRFEHWDERQPGRHYARGYTCEECGGRRSDCSTKWCIDCRNRVGTRAAA